MARANRDSIQDFKAREVGVFTTLGAQKTFLLLLFAIVSPVLSIIALIQGLSH
jgi:hypothetical protein